MRKILLILLLILIPLSLGAFFYDNLITNSHDKTLASPGVIGSLSGMVFSANDSINLLSVGVHKLTTINRCYFGELASDPSGSDYVSINWTSNATIGAKGVGNFTENPELKDNKFYAILCNSSASTYTRYSVSQILPLNGTTISWYWRGIAPNWSSVEIVGGRDNIYNLMNITTGISRGIVTSLISPENEIELANNKVNFTSSADVKRYSLTNSTFTIWNLDGTIFSKTTNTTFDSSNNSKVQVEGLTPDEYLWNTKICGTNATGYYCSWDENRTILTGSNLSNIKYNSSTYETKSETFTSNLTISPGYTPTNGLLIWNGTSYTASLTSLGENEYFLSKTIDIPVSNQTIAWYFNWTIGTSKFSSESSNQSVARTFFGLCNDTCSTKFLNISFKDESNNEKINATITSSNFEYYLGSGTIYKTFSYSTANNYSNYTFCATPNSTINVVPYVQYKMGTDYPQRIWNPSVQTYSSTITQKVLYLLSSINGIYVTFQVVNTANQVISGVSINATRLIDSEVVLVGAGDTGTDGTTTFWLNPDFSHTITASKTGYSDVITTLTPTQSSYTITLGTQTSTYNNTFQGITYSIRPNETSLVNDTEYTFGLTINSNYWDLEEYGFNLRLSNGSVISGGSTNVEGTPLTFNYNTGNQSVIYMDYYWVIDGEYTNATKYWVVYNTQHTEYSIWKFFTDFNSYMSVGLFGIDNFGKVLLVFLILFMSVGIVSYKYGLASPIAVSALMWAIIFFFDIVVGLIPNYTGINHLPTYIVSLILVLILIREVQR